jgi:hypothetical protein
MQKSQSSGKNFGAPIPDPTALKIVTYLAQVKTDQDSHYFSSLY